MCTFVVTVASPPSSLLVRELGSVHACRASRGWWNRAWFAQAAARHFRSHGCCQSASVPELSALARTSLAPWFGRVKGSRRLKARGRRQLSHANGRQAGTSRQPATPPHTQQRPRCGGASLAAARSAATSRRRSGLPDHRRDFAPLPRGNSRRRRSLRSGSTSRRRWAAAPARSRPAMTCAATPANADLSTPLTPLKPTQSAPDVLQSAFRILFVVQLQVCAITSFLICSILYSLHIFGG